MRSFYEPAPYDVFEDRIEDLSLACFALMDSLQDQGIDPHPRLDELAVVASLYMEHPCCELQESGTAGDDHDDDCPNGWTDRHFIDELRAIAGDESLPDDESVPQRIRDMIEDAALYADPIE